MTMSVTSDQGLLTRVKFLKVNNFESCQMILGVSGCTVSLSLSLKRSQPCESPEKNLHKYDQ